MHRWHAWIAWSKTRQQRSIPSSGFGLRTVVLLTPALLWGVHASWRITTDGGLLCWPKLYGGIVGTLGLLGRKRANRGAHRPLVLGCEPPCCSRRLSCGWARNPSWRQLRTSEPLDNKGVLKILSRISVTGISMVSVVVCLSSVVQW